MKTHHKENTPICLHAVDTAETGGFELKGGFKARVPNLAPLKASNAAYKYGSSPVKPLVNQCHEELKAAWKKGKGSNPDLNAVRELVWKTFRVQPSNAQLADCLVSDVWLARWD